MGGYSEWSEVKAFIKARADFYLDFAEALEDRASLVEEIKRYRTVALKNKKNGLAAMFAKWLRNLDKGMFTEAIKDTVPKTDCMILRSYEAAGQLPQGLRYLSEIVTKSQKMKSTMMVAVTVPIILIVFISAMLAGAGLFMVPILEQIYPHEAWPFMGQVLYPLSLFVKNYGLYVALLVIGLMVGFAYSIPRWTGSNRVKMDNHLPYSIFRDFNGALFLTSLSALLKGGTSLIDALYTMRTMSNPWMSWHISAIIRALDKQSSQPARALNTGIFSQETTDRLIAYGERSSFVEAMGKIGFQALDKTDVALSKQAKTINTMMMLMAGLMLGIIISGVVLTSLAAEAYMRKMMY